MLPEHERDEAAGHGSQELVGGGDLVGAAEGHDDDEDEEEEDDQLAEGPEGVQEVQVHLARASAVVEVDGLEEELLRRVGRVLVVQKKNQGVRQPPQATCSSNEAKE